MNNKKLKELKEMAKKYKIKGRSKMRKKELITALKYLKEPFNKPKIYKRKPKKRVKDTLITLTQFNKPKIYKRKPKKRVKDTLITQFKKPLIYKRKTKKRIKKDFIELKKVENNEKSEYLQKKKIYEEMKKNFGNCGSWAVWDTENYKHLDYIMNKDVSNQIQNKYVLIGLNISRPIKEVYGNFHSAFNDKSTTATNANKLFYSLYNTPLWGSYMTDIIKFHEDPSSTNVVKYFKKNPEKMKKHVETFKKELDILGNKNPILVTMGTDTYKIVKKYLPKFKIYNIPHYATQWSTKKYIEKIHTEIEKITKIKILENMKITLFKMNIKELKQESKKRGLKGTSKLRKIDIIKILEK